MRLTQTPSKKEWLGVPLSELDIPNDLDMELFTKHVVGSIDDLKARDIFKIIDLHEKAIAFIRDAGFGDDIPREVQGV